MQRATAVRVAYLMHEEKLRERIERVVTERNKVLKVLYDALSPKQREEICFAWDYQDPKRGLLRTFVANNWQITEPSLITHKDPFYTDEQRDIVRKIFEGLIQPEWQTKIDKQLEDDAGGFGAGDRTGRRLRPL